MKQKLKIALLVDSEYVSAWEYAMLERIKKSSYAQIDLIIENNAEAPKQSLFQKLKIHFKHLWFLMFSMIENKLVKLSPDAFVKKSIDKLCNDATIIKVVPEQTKFIDRICSDDIEKIQGYDIDVFIRLGFRILKGDILKIAKSGVWSYHHGDNDVNRGRPPGMWEFLEKWNTTAMILQILNEDLDDGKILYKSHSATNTNSWKKNKNGYYWKGVSLLPRKLKELHVLGNEAFFQKVHEDNKELKFYFNRLYKYPKRAELIWKLVQRYLSITKNKVVNLFYYDQWILLYKFNKKGGPSKTIYQFKKIIPPRDKFWADPFVVNKEGEYYIFFEEYLYKTKKGHLSVLKIDKKGNYSEPEIILKKDYHLSYPFVFKEGGAFYMIPETKGNNTIELYKCIEFPNKWELEKVLMRDIQAVDATILKKDNQYWMFVNMRDHQGVSTVDELFLFSSKELVSEQWESHPQNPVISDVRYSRPAGRTFEYNGELYRPSQNNAKQYGHAMNMNKIVTLNKESYKEEVVSSIFPNWEKNVKATHTFNFDENLTVMDALIRRRKSQ